MTSIEFRDFARHCKEFYPDVHKWYSSDQCWMYVTFADMRERKRIDLRTSWSDAIQVMKEAQTILNTKKK